MFWRSLTIWRTSPALMLVGPRAVRPRRPVSVGHGARMPGAAEAVNQDAHVRVQSSEPTASSAHLARQTSEQRAVPAPYDSRDEIRDDGQVQRDRRDPSR